MSAGKPSPGPFTTLVSVAVERSGLDSEDLRTSLLPLFREVAGLHEVGMVAPLEGLESLTLDDRNRVSCLGTAAALPSRNRTKLNEIQKPESLAFTVLGEQRITRDFDAGVVDVDELDVARPDEPITRPIFLAGYEVWEHQIGHHDEAADIESLGLILASLALGLDFRRMADVEQFVRHRRNLFAVNHRLNPVIARLIGEMAEPDRHRRAQDLASLAERFDTYRDQPLDFDLARVDGATSGSVRGRRTAIQQALRDRLFEINRRNRMVYFQPNQQSVNVTLGSVPSLLDVRNIEPSQIATWKAPLSNSITSGKSIALNSVLRFEDSPYLPGSLDKLISQARRDRAEFGMAQLRLVVCFLRWHNLKELREERINSPLLLLPVELTKKRGVRDSYGLSAVSSIAETNPALRHVLRQVYDIDLPETIDLEHESVDDLHANLVAQIRSSEPGVVLNKVDRPALEMIHQRAKMRLDQYTRRQRSMARVPSAMSHSYSYGPGPVRPHGVQLFNEKVRYRSPEALRMAAGAPPVPRATRLTPIESSGRGSPDPAAHSSGSITVVERRTYSLSEPTSGNPYQWDFDLCALTIANFNYRKMTLVRDYTQVMSTDEPSDSFDRLFSLDARPFDDDNTPSLPIAEQHLVVPADETQRAAIARSRSGRSFIIQGPPGTGKSQTITNLIADYVARGKRVLFVCEKRAAIDVVHARLRSQGLDELCALIHDSQADKKTFIQNCKSTYESWIASTDTPEAAQARRDSIVARMLESVRAIERIDTAMGTKPAGSDSNLRELLQRCIELVGVADSTDSKLAHGRLPTVEEWHGQEAVTRRVANTLMQLGAPPILAVHPIAETHRQIMGSDRPSEELARRCEQVMELQIELRAGLVGVGLDPDVVTVADISDLALLGERIALMPDSSLGVLRPTSPESREVETLAASQRSALADLERVRACVSGWRDPLSPADATAALKLAREKESSTFKFLSGSWRALKKTVESRYDFSSHAIRPTISSVVEALVAFHSAQSAVTDSEAEAKAAYGNADLNVVVNGLKLVHNLTNERIVELRDSVSNAPRGSNHSADVLRSISSLVVSTADAHRALFDRVGFQTLPETHRRCEHLRGTAGSLGSLIADLRLISTSPSVDIALRTIPLSPDAMEHAILAQTIRRYGDLNLDFERFTGREMAEQLGALQRDLRELLDANALLVRSRVRSAFREHVALSGTSANQLTTDQKVFKKRYATGRRELEHEFSKTMRYRSIRDLASSETGAVVMDMRPIWLMSPLSVSDTLPLDPLLFDVVVFDEASQIPLEEAIPALYRSHQTIVVGDQMQLPPTQFFSTATTADVELEVDDDEGQRVSIVLDGDSFLAQSAATLPSTMLAWHYRSRSEELIGFSNAAFYGGALSTVPDLHRPPSGLSSINPAETTGSVGDAAVDGLLSRTISFHFIEGGVYEARRNTAEANYIAELVRSLLARNTAMTIGVAAFSEAQQTEIETALERLAASDPIFAVQLEAEELREDDDQFVGLFVKNLENIQGDERDVIIMSVCYGPGPTGRMVMNFGPINQRGGEKRLNVIFSRARKHMAIVSSIRAPQITNEHNDGAYALRQFLDYAEALSMGDADRADLVLKAVNPLGRGRLEDRSHSPVPEALAAALRSKGFLVELDHGRSRFRCDLAVRRSTDGDHRVAVLVDTEHRSRIAGVEERSVTHPMVLTSFGWRVVHVLTKDWWSQPDVVVRSIEDAMSDG